MREGGMKESESNSDFMRTFKLKNPNFWCQFSETYQPETKIIQLAISTVNSGTFQVQRTDL